MYEKSQKPPAPGSPLEIVFILVWKMRQDIDFHKQRATLQALLSQKDVEDKKILEAFSDLKNAFFPFDKNEKKDELKTMRAALMREVSRGPVSVTVTQDMDRKKVASRLVRGDNKLAQHQSMKDSGQVVDIDSFDKARRRKRPVF